MNVDYRPAEWFHHTAEEKFAEIAHVFSRSAFYRQKIAQSRSGRAELRTLGQLKDVPFTAKQELRDTPHTSKLYGLPRGRVAYLFSSTGTTGMPTVYPWSREDTAVLSEISARAMGRVSVGADDLAVILAPFGMPVMWYCMMTQYASVDAGVVPLGLAQPDRILDIIRLHEPTLLASIPLAGTRLLEFLQAQYAIPFEHNLRQFHCGGDFLSESRRRRIEACWKLECFDFYGLSEIMGPIAGECPMKNGLHLAADYVYLEVVDPITQQIVPEGQEGIAVFTSLWDKGAPMLRYWSDDFVILDSSPCACGRSSPRIFFQGRMSDSIVVHSERVFAYEIEDVLLAHESVGNEWQMRVAGTDPDPDMTLDIELAATHFDEAAAIEGRLQDLLGCRCRLHVVPPFHLSRTDLKPSRIRRL